MVDSLWSTVKNLTWSNNGFLDASGAQKNLYVTQRSNTTSCGSTAFALYGPDSATDYIQAKMTSADFSTLKGYTWSGTNEWWIDSSGVHKTLQLVRDTDGLYLCQITTV
jgi:hypothetical protein